MIQKRLGQLLIGGIFTVCAAVALALADRIAKEKAASKEPPLHASGACRIVDPQ